MHLDLVSFFEVLGESFDERFGRHILDGVAVCVDEGEVLLKNQVSHGTRQDSCLHPFSLDSMIFIK